MIGKLLLVCCAILLQSCGFASDSQISAAQNIKEIKHANNLVVGVPAGFAARDDDNGFVIEPENNENVSLRRPIAVNVSFEKGKSIPQEAPLESKTVNGKTVFYRIEKSEGGSGGEQYYLEVFEKAGDGWITYSQSEQSEYAQPDFALCWQVVRHTSLRN